MKRVMQCLIAVLCFSTFGFGVKTGPEKVIDVKVPASVFTNWLEYEVYTVGEQNISVSITNETGKIFFSEERTLYGEAYLNLDTSEFPKGVYHITVLCGNTQADVVAEKI